MTAVAIAAIVVVSSRCLSTLRHLTFCAHGRGMVWPGYELYTSAEYGSAQRRQRRRAKESAEESSQPRKTSGQSSDAKSGRNLEAAARGAEQQLQLHASLKTWRICLSGERRGCCERQQRRRAAETAEEREVRLQRERDRARAPSAG